MVPYFSFKLQFPLKGDELAAMINGSQNFDLAGK